MLLLSRKPNHIINLIHQCNLIFFNHIITVNNPVLKLTHSFPNILNLLTIHYQQKLVCEMFGLVGSETHLWAMAKDDALY